MEIGEGAAAAAGGSEKKPKKKLEAKFVSTLSAALIESSPAKAKCGDLVGLEAIGTEIPDSTSITFEVKSLTDGNTLATVSKPLTAGVALGEWASQKPTDQWPNPEIDMTAKGGGQTANSENKLVFYKYASIGDETKTIACRNPPYGWTGKFDLVFGNGTITITIKIKLRNRLGSKPASGGAMPTVGSPVSAADKRLMAADIQSKLTNQWLMHREKCERGKDCNCPNARKCCKFNVKIVVSFVESGEHHVVNLFQGAGRANASNWTRTKTRDNSWAHETGHLLGWYDEYAGAGGAGRPPRWQVPRAGAIMSSGLTVPDEYYWDFRDWFRAKTSEPWALLKP